MVPEVINGGQRAQFGFDQITKDTLEAQRAHVWAFGGALGIH